MYMLCNFMPAFVWLWPWTLFQRRFFFHQTLKDAWDIMTNNTVRLIQYNRWKSFSLKVSSASILLLVTLVGEYIFLRFYLFLFLERGEEREKGRERNINVWLLFVCPLLGPWPATQACALTGNQTSDLLVPTLHSIHWATPARAVGEY